MRSSKVSRPPPTCHQQGELPSPATRIVKQMFSAIMLIISRPLSPWRKVHLPSYLLVLYSCGIRSVQTRVKLAINPSITGSTIELPGLQRDSAKHIIIPVNETLLKSMIRCNLLLSTGGSFILFRLARFFPSPLAAASGRSHSLFFFLEFIEQQLDETEVMNFLLNTLCVGA